MKTCSKCGLERADDDFYVNGARRRPECKSCTYLHQTAAKFGLTPVALTALYEAQGFKCAICRQPCETYESLSVDHDHRCCSTPGRSCGQCVRGLLCVRCNHGLGRFRDSPELLRAAIDYLGRTP